MDLKLTPFAMAVAHFGLTLEQQEKAKALAATVKVNLSDADVWKVVESVATRGTFAELLEKLEAHFARLEKQTAEANAEMIRKGNALLGNIEDRVSRVIEEKLKQLPLSLNAEAQKVIRAEYKQARRDEREDLERQDFRLERFRYSVLLAGFAIVFLAGVGWAYTIGGDNKVAANAEIANFQARDDAKLGRMVNTNNNWLAVLPGCEVFERQGRKMGRCEISFDRPLTSSAGTDALRLLWTKTQVTLGPVGLLVSGVVLGALGMMAARRRKSA